MLISYILTKGQIGNHYVWCNRKHKESPVMYSCQKTKLESNHTSTYNQ